MVPSRHDHHLTTLSKEGEEKMFRILRISEVSTRVGLCRASIYMLIKQGDFPVGIKLSKRARGWTEAEIEDWLEERRKSA